MSHAAAAVEYELVFGQRRHAHYEIAANRLIGDQDIKLQVVLVVHTDLEAIDATMHR